MKRYISAVNHFTLFHIIPFHCRSKFKFITFVRYLGTSSFFFFFNLRFITPLRFIIVRCPAMKIYPEIYYLTRRVRRIRYKQILFDICYYFVFIISRKNSWRIGNRYGGTSKLGYSNDHKIIHIWKLLISFSINSNREFLEFSSDSQNKNLIFL